MDSNQIYATLISKMPKSKHYVKRYVDFVFACMQHNRGVTLDYTERHHICPRSMFPEYESLSKNPWNKAVLTGRQHIIAHWMLSNAFGGGMSSAFWKMANCNDKRPTGRVVVNTRLFESAKKAASNAMKEFWTPERLAKSLIVRRETCARNGTFQHISDTHKAYALTPEGQADYADRGVKTKDTKMRLGIYTIAGEKLSRYLNQVDSETGLTNGQIRAQNVDYDVYREHLGMTLREHRSVEVSGDKNPAKRDEVKVKISESLKDYYKDNCGKFTGKTHSEESKRKQSEAKLGENNAVFNTVWVNDGTVQRRVKRSEIPEGFVLGKFGYKHTKKTVKVCPHCNLQGASGNMMRYHFDNCKLKGLVDLLDV